jgi:hypothetical protein
MKSHANFFVILSVTRFVLWLLTPSSPFAFSDTFLLSPTGDKKAFVRLDPGVEALDIANKVRVSLYFHLLLL